jgi:hypothetical protein
LSTALRKILTNSRNSGLCYFLVLKISSGNFGQELDLEFHSVFDGKKHKNKVWSAIVEGILLSQALAYF